MDIPALFTRPEPVFSFEFFLPKTPAGTDSFLDNLRRLKDLAPSFVSLTYGAGGSARDRTIDMVERMQREVGIETVCHLTGITHTRAEMFRNLERIEAAGIHNIMALRGDQPQDWPGALPGDFPHAADLVRFIRQAGGFHMAVAGYPEGHPEARSRQEDLAHLAAKRALQTFERDKQVRGAHRRVARLAPSFFDSAVRDREAENRAERRRWMATWEPYIAKAYGVEPRPPATDDELPPLPSVKIQREVDLKLAEREMWMGAG